MTPKIEGNFHWQVFVVDKGPEGSSRSGFNDAFNDAMSDWLGEWCDSNCTGQYFMSMRSTSFNCCLPIKNTSPLQKQFPSSEIRIHGKLIIAFEKDEDAVLFKTTYGG